MPCICNTLSIASALRSGGGDGGGDSNLLLHVIVTGQSNARGTLPILTTSNASPRLLMFNGGIAPQAEPENLMSFVPLLESDVGLEVDFPYPGGETMCSALGKFLIQHTPAKILFTQSCLNGAQYSQIKKGTDTYDNAVAQVAAAKALADDQGLNYRVLAVCAIHGEADQQFGVTTYAVDLAEWQDDFDTDIKAITGQSELVSLFACQQAGNRPDFDDAFLNGTASALNLEEAYQAAPGLVSIPWPRYCTDHPDGLHVSAWGQRLMGEYYGKAIHALALDETAFRPLSLASATLDADVITLEFHVPVAPLRFDLERVLFQPNYGFVYSDEDESVEIENVEITGLSTVEITLSGTPTGENPEIRYACDMFLVSAPRFGSGKGNLCDSDETESSYGLDLANFCTNFRRFL